MSKHLTVSACSLLTLALFTSTALADHARKPDDHAPAGVMGDHLHKQGEWMVGYTYDHTHMSGLRNGNDNANTNQVLGFYGEAATKMDMDMHMFEIMYGVTDDLTLMVMPQYMEMSMTHKSLHGGGHMHEHKVSGFGDTEVTGLYSVYRTEGARAHLNLGLSLPTGSTDETFANHHDVIYHLPYNMQLGSGTFDPILGATYAAEMGEWSWGAQTINYLRLGQNDEGYRQGNKYTATAWAAHNLTEFASLSFRLKGEAWGDVHGRDASLLLTTIAGADPDEQAGERVMALVGVNLMADEEWALKGHRLAAEFGLPVYERYSGPQPDTDYKLTLSWQWAF